MRATLVLILLLWFTGGASAQNAVVKGTVKDESGEVVPFCQILFPRQKGVYTSNELGQFSILIPRHSESVVFHALGYLNDTLSAEALRALPDPIVIVLRQDRNELEGIEIVADARDVARDVVALAIEHRERWRKSSIPCEYNYYAKISVQRDGRDTAKVDETLPDSVKEVLRNKRIVTQYHLSEIAAHSFFTGLEYKEVILGNRVVRDDPPSDGLSIRRSMSYGERDIRPEQFVYMDARVYESNTGYRELDLYQNLIDLSGVTPKPILSPIGNGALLSYKFGLQYSYRKQGKKYFKISVQPLFRTESLLTGTMDIEEGSWAVVNFELEVNPYALVRHQSFRWNDVVRFTADSTLQVEQRTLLYAMKETSSFFTGKVILRMNEFEPLSEVPSAKAFTETRKFDERAFELPEEYWATKRNSTFDDVEQRYIQRCDSLQKVYADPKYFAEKDSAFNKLKFLDFILYGVGYRNRQHKYLLYFDPLVAQINPLGIGGYRHRMTVNLDKDFDNGQQLQAESFVDYGFNNRDVKGKLGLGWTYAPKKFVRTFVRVGDIYQMVNGYASLGSIFSRSNFVRAQTISIAQRMEVLNGLYAELFLDYSDQKPIAGLQQDRWSGQVFGDVNNPLNFQRYIKSEVRLQLQYYPRQKYVIKRGRKIILGSDYPEFRFIYRKGVPGLFRSEVNFDYAEITVRQSRVLGRLGQVDWEAQAGSFLNTRNLRILEHRYFRGSDRFFFSDPMNSYQLLGPTFSTASAYIRGNYFHHFNGILLNKIPLLNRLKLTEAAGASFVSIPQERLYHTEMYLGIERVVAIRKELFRFGVYACSNASTLGKAVFEFKLGVNFFNTYTNRWSY